MVFIYSILIFLIIKIEQKIYLSYTRSVYCLYVLTVLVLFYNHNKFILNNISRPNMKNSQFFHLKIRSNLPANKYIHI